MEINLNVSEAEIEKLIAKTLSSQFHKTCYTFLATNGYNAYFVTALERAMDEAFKDIEVTQIIKQTCEETMKEVFRDWLIKNSKDIKLFTGGIKKKKVDG